MSNNDTITISRNDFVAIQMALEMGRIWIQECKDQNRILKDQTTSAEMKRVERIMQKALDA